MNVNRKPIPPDLRTIIRIPKNYPNAGKTETIIVPGSKLQRYALTHWKLKNRDPPDPAKKERAGLLINAIRTINNAQGKGAWAYAYGKKEGYSKQDQRETQDEGIGEAQLQLDSHHKSRYGFTVVSRDGASGNVTEKSVRDYLIANRIPVADDIEKRVANYYRRMRKDKKGARASQQAVLENIRRFLNRETDSLYAGQEGYRPVRAFGTRFAEDYEQFGYTPRSYNQLLSSYD